MSKEKYSHPDRTRLRCKGDPRSDSETRSSWASTVNSQTSGENNDGPDEESVWLGPHLYRMVLDDGRVVHTETLLKGLARIRDIEAGPDGAIYLLLEHGSGGQIVRSGPEQDGPEPEPKDQPGLGSAGGS